MAHVAPPPSIDPPRSVLELDPGARATRIVLERDLSPLDRLSADQRRRLLVRVLCGLVAYDDGPTADRLAG
jgi:hypothetical protein